MRSDSYSLSVIVPVFNEVGLVEEAVARIHSFSETNFRDFEILIIESGSTDGTAELIERIALRFSRVKVIHEGEKRGFGSALRLGYKNATKDLVWMITVDLPFPLEALLTALPLLSQHDCVVSYRASDKRGFGRRLQSAVYNRLVKMVLGLKVRHVNSAFKVFKREIIEDVRLVSDGWLIDAEILYRLKQQQRTYAEISVEMLQRKGGRSSITLATALALVKELIRLWSREVLIRRGKRRIGL